MEISSNIGSKREKFSFQTLSDGCSIMTMDSYTMEFRGEDAIIKPIKRYFLSCKNEGNIEIPKFIVERLTNTKIDNEQREIKYDVEF